MPKNKITIVGAGNVGAAIAHLCLLKELGNVVLVDVAVDTAKGKALDMMEGLPVHGSNVKAVGTDDYELTKDSDIVVITAGFARKPGMTREDLLGKNFNVIKEVSLQVSKYSPNSIIIVVTNPLDVMTYAAYKISGFSKKKVIGQAGVLDSSRLRYFISEELNVSVNDISAMVLGSHGDSMVPVIGQTLVKGRPLTEFLSNEKINELVERTRKAGEEIVKYYKTGSAYYSTAAATLEMIDTIINDQKKLLPCSVYLEGEYGISDVFLGVPTILGKNGIEKIEEISLNNQEKEALKKSAEIVKENIKLLHI